MSVCVTEHVCVPGRHWGAMDKSRSLLGAICSCSLCQDSEDRQQVSVFRHVTSSMLFRTPYPSGPCDFPGRRPALLTQTWKQYSFIRQHFRAHAWCIKYMHNLEEQAEDQAGALPKRFSSISRGDKTNFSMCRQMDSRVTLHHSSSLYTLEWRLS